MSTRNGFRDLLAMSAYDHVAAAPYPATIRTTGLNDPVLLRADARGHGVVRDVAAEIDEYADVWTFMLWQLGAPDFPTT